MPKVWNQNAQTRNGMLVWTEPDRNGTPMVFPAPTHVQTPAQWKTSYFLLTWDQVALQKHRTDWNASLGTDESTERLGKGTARSAPDLEQTGRTELECA